MSEPAVGIVMIGRNEGDRLRRALDSVCDQGHPIVYVDSGSTDGSQNTARGRGVTVVELDMATPFTAARARNAGFRKLRADHPDTALVQFIDGDCEVEPGWLEQAAAAFDGHPRLAAVCGHLEERHPERSVYNRICAVEWQLGPVGSTTSFGGNVMITADALDDVGGWDPTIIAGEEPELAARLRQAGYDLLRLDAMSMVHDVDMHSAAQWWRRARRAGYAFAQVERRHGRGPERTFVREKQRALLWGLALPAAAVALARPTRWRSLVVLARYPGVAAKLTLETRRQGHPWSTSIAWAVSCVVSVFPQALGVLSFHADTVRGRTPQLIEHKRNR